MLKSVSKGSKATEFNPRNLTNLFGQIWKWSFFNNYSPLWRSIIESSRVNPITSIWQIETSTRWMLSFVVDFLITSVTRAYIQLFKITGAMLFLVYASTVHSIPSDAVKWFDYNPRFNVRIVPNGKPACIS